MANKRLRETRRPVEGYVLLPGGGKVAFKIYAGSKYSAHKQMKETYPMGRVYIVTREKEKNRGKRRR